jgi:hypothetical protein
MKPGDYILVHFVKPQPVGLRFERTRHEWPLHMTLVPWFSVGDDEELEVGLSEVAGKFSSFKVVVGEEAMFGPYGDVLVNVIANHEADLPLHLALVEMLKANKAEYFNDRWVGLGHRAHITHHTQERCHEGDELLVDDFHLVRLTPPNTCEVIKRFALRG